MSVFIVPNISKIFIDGLSITLPIGSKAEENAIIKCFKEKELLDSWGYTGTHKKGYDYYAYPIVNEATDDKLFLQCSPSSGQKNFFRIEFNPSKVDMSEVRILMNQLLAGGYKQLVEYGRITRVDVAFDASRISPHQLLFHVPQFSIGKCYYKSGNVQSVYLGCDESENQYVVYDKNAHIQYNNQKKKEKFKAPVPVHGLTRIEYRYRPDKPFMLKELLTIKNPFNNLKLTAYPQSLVSKDSLFRLLLAVSRFQGMNQALLNIAKHDRPKYIKLLINSGKTAWYKPDTIWESFSAAVYKLVHPYEYLLTTE